MNQDRNRLRAFADVVGVDAWHKSFKPGYQEVDLKVDVTFKEGRIGGEPESPVQFRLSLRRATLVVVIPENEPAEVLRDSIRRDDHGDVIEWELTSTQAVHKSAGVAAQGAASLNVFQGGAQAEIIGQLGAKFASDQTQTEKSSGRKRGMKSRFVFDNVEQCYTWVIDCESTEFLDGRAWDASSMPLMTLRDKREDLTRGIPPNIRVAVKCLREDLIISDISVKAGVSITDRLTGNEGKIKIRAAEAYIRTKLCEVGLNVGEISNDFAKIVLLDVMAKTEG